MIRLKDPVYYAWYQNVVKKIVDRRHKITLFGIVMTINYPLFGLFWEFEEGFQFINEFILRIIAMILCFVLACNRFLPMKLVQLLPLLWYGTVLFCLPFFFSYLTLLNHCSVLWLMNCVSAIFLLLLIVDVLPALILLFIGSSLAFIIFSNDPHHIIVYIPGEVSLLSLAITYIAAIIIGVLFARDREIMYADKLLKVRVKAENLAHDLLTPLANIHLQAELQRVVLASRGHDSVLLQEALQDHLNQINHEVAFGSKLINMSLAEVGHDKFDTKNFAINSIKELLNNSINTMDLACNAIVNCEIKKDFLVWIDEGLFNKMLLAILNIRVAMQRPSLEKKAHILVEEGEFNEDYNCCNIKIVTELTINSEDFAMPILNYCKLLMDVAGGSVDYIFENNVYMHFIIKFPKID